MLFFYIAIYIFLLFYSIEARKCDSVVVANIDVKKLKAQTVRYSSVINIFVCGYLKIRIFICFIEQKTCIHVQESGCPSTPNDYLPSKEWQQQQISLFSDLRDQLSRHYLAGFKLLGVDKLPPPNLVFRKLTLNISSNMNQKSLLTIIKIQPSIEKEEDWSTYCSGPTNGPLLQTILSFNQVQLSNFFCRILVYCYIVYFKMLSFIALHHFIVYGGDTA